MANMLHLESINAHNVAIQFESQMRDAGEEEEKARAMVRRRTETERLERVEAARIEAEETTWMKVERRAAMDESRIVIDAAQLKNRGKPPRIRRHGQKRRGGRPQQRAQPMVEEAKKGSWCNCQGIKTKRI